MPNYAQAQEVLYHIGISKQMIKNAKYALLPGDPGRVEGLAKALGPAEFLGCHREFTSWLVTVQGQPVLVISTGMGCPCVSIAMEELARLGITHFIRVGTTGSLQENLNLGDVVISKAAVRTDGASKCYAPVEYPAVADLDITLALRQAAEELQIPHQVGITVTTDSFWPGQERYDSFSGYVPRKFQGSLNEWKALGACNYEMETATLFVVAQSMGLSAASICGVVAQRLKSEHVASPETYQLASGRFMKVVKQALVNLTGKEK